LEILFEKSVDVVLLDLAMPKLNGIQTLNEIMKYFPAAKVIVVSCNTDANIIQSCLNTGAIGFISKFVKCSELITAIKVVAKDGCYICSRSLKALTSKKLQKTDDITANCYGFTKREKDILNLVTIGDSNSKIAEKLCLSIRTVETHRRNMLQKFGAKNFIGLINTVMEKNMIHIMDLV